MILIPSFFIEVKVMIFVVSAEDAKELKKKIKNEMNRRKADYGNYDK